MVAWFVHTALDAPLAAWMPLPVSNASVAELTSRRTGEYAVTRFDDVVHLSAEPCNLPYPLRRAASSGDSPRVGTSRRMKKSFAVSSSSSSASIAALRVTPATTGP